MCDLEQFSQIQSHINKADSYDLTMLHIHLGRLFHLITFVVNTMYLQIIYQHDAL